MDERCRARSTAHLQTDRSEDEDSQSSPRGERKDEGMRQSGLGAVLLRVVARLYLRFRRHRGFRFLVIFAALASVLTFYIGYHLLYTVELWYGNPRVERWCDKEELPRYVIKREPDEITVVTAFFDLGVFKKGENFWQYHSPYKYKRWMRPLSKMANPLVVYLEDEKMVEYVREVRSCFPETHTKIIRFSRNGLWAFSQLGKIREIYSQPDYPKHYPNTVIPEYACAMHAKYEFLDQVAKDNPFKTLAFAWLDIGFFRNLDDYNTDLFKLLPPAKFDPTKVGMTQAKPHDPNMDPKKAVKDNYVWVAGGMVLGTNKTLHKFAREYREAVKALLDVGAANTDQQVLYAMNTVIMRRPDQVKIQTYLCHEGQLGLHGPDARYFCLGYVCKDAWDGIHRKPYGH